MSLLSFVIVLVFVLFVHHSTMTFASEPNWSRLEDCVNGAWDNVFLGVQRPQPHPPGQFTFGYLFEQTGAYRDRVVSLPQFNQFVDFIKICIGAPRLALDAQTVFSNWRHGNRPVIQMKNLLAAFFETLYGKTPDEALQQYGVSLQPGSGR